MNTCSPLPDRLARQTLAASEFRAISLLSSVAAGDETAFDELYLLWADTLLGIALRMLRDRAEAEEAVQDVFVRIWHKAGDYAPERARPFVWAFTILRGACMDRWRRAGRLKRRALAAALEAPVGAMEGVAAAPVLDPGLLEAVRGGLDLLSAEDKRCVELYVFGEYTQDEISEALSSPLGTVKTRMRRALKQLRTYLKNQ